GTWTFTPNTGFVGVANLTATVSDGPASTTQAVNVNVSDVIPAVNTFNVTIPEDTSTTIYANQLLMLDSTVAGNTLNITALSVPANQGTLVDNHDGSWTFTPNIGFIGEVTLSATVNDGYVNVTQNVNVTVTDVPPTVNPVSYTMNEDGSIIINPNNLLSADSTAAG